MSTNGGEIFPGDIQTPKRKYSGSLTYLERLKRKVDSLEPKPTSITSLTGPIYKVTGSSFVLRSKYPESVDEKWNRERNPNGVVPVVVHPDLVKGLDPEKPQELTEVQREGVQFLWDCYESGQGGILAHDMGLGKTRTGITFVATLLQQSKNSLGKSNPGITKCLVIVPKNAVSVWQNEIDLWVPQHDIPCKVVVVMPGQRDGGEVVTEFMQPNSLKNIMIVSYETFLKYNTGYENYGFQKEDSQGEIGLVICDEAHILKNPLTARVKNMRKFLSAHLWVGLTGTPFQNSLEELCHLVSFFRRDSFLLPVEINNLCKSIDDPLKKNRKLNRAEKELLIRLREKLLPALHYKKNDLSIERHDVILCVPLDGHPDYGKQINSQDEDDVYPAMQHELYKRLSGCLNSPAGKEMKFLEKLSYLQKACLHPLKVDEAMQKCPGTFSDLINFVDDEIPKEVRMDPEVKIRLPGLSAKIRLVAELVRCLSNDYPDEKMIIVSSSTVLLGMVKSYLNDFLKMKVVVFDGETSESARERNLKIFETDDNCRFLLLSLKAGGTALTLTRANHLVIMDPDYNPANDKQAIARILRPSQQRTAFIYRFLATGTHEEFKFLRQLEKDDMEQSVQSEGSVNVQCFSSNKEFLEYKTDEKSSLKVYLDRLERESDLEDFSNDDLLDVTLAEELRESQQYSIDNPPGDNLKLLKKIWNLNLVSYAFHISNVNVPDDIDAQRLVLTSTDTPDSFQV